MHDRSVLGAADVPDDVLADFAARLLDLPADEPVELRTSAAEVAPYDLPALTTAGRFWVRGTLEAGGTEHPFAFFVKVVQSWARAPEFAFVPEHLREVALAGLSWQVEPAVYRSDLAARLPEGLAMPRCAGVVDLDAESAALWLEAVDCRSGPWDLDRLARAAHALGRLAASEQVRSAVPARDGSLVRQYAEGRLGHQVVPALRSDVWGHPLLAGTFDEDLRARLLAAADTVPAVVDELEAVPTGSFHGDACTRNLLVPHAGDGFVLIDFGFWGCGPVGFDLGQLVVGEVQLGERPAQDLPALEAACVPAYASGLAAEGMQVDAATLRRAHALQLLLFTGLSALPLEHLGAPPTPELQALAGQRAALARHVLDLVDATD